MGARNKPRFESEPERNRMSTDWNVHCLDCKDTHYFSDANWRDDDMALICKHAGAIAAMAPLIAGANLINIEISTSYGRIDADWFAKHLGHNLVPISEYGHFMKQCPEYVDCLCGSNKRCTLDVGHEGKHDTRAR